MDQDGLAARIAQAGDEGWTTLDLSQEGLKYLPPEIGNLTALTRLDLGSNHLTELPPEIGNLTSLTWLDLRGDHLTTWLPEMKKLVDRGVVVLSGDPFQKVDPGAYFGDLADQITW